MENEEIMKICPKCNKEFPDDVNFCKYDGTKLVEKNAKTESEKKCPKCGAPAVNGAKFCNMCGSPLTAERDNSAQNESAFSQNNAASLENKSCEMVFVDGGTVDNTTLNSFAIGKYPVTQALYQKVMGTNPSYFQDKTNPVENVYWYDAVEFCNRLSEKDGLEPCYSRIKDNKIKCDFSKNGYRLPTEDEWEFAAKGGNKSRGYTYSGSDDLDEVGWYNGNSQEKPHAVGQRKPNELGIYDMSGNVWEWCNDLDVQDEKCATRGASFNTNESCCSIFFRNPKHPYLSNCECGFRLVRSM